MIHSCNPSAQNTEVYTFIANLSYLGTSVLQIQSVRGKIKEEKKKTDVSVLVLYKALKLTLKKIYRLLGTQRQLSHSLPCWHSG